MLPLVLIGAPRNDVLQGPSSRSSNSVDNLGSYPRASGFQDGLSRTTLRRLPYRASSQNAAGLIPSGTRWRPHHKCGWVVSQDYKPLQCTIMVHASSKW
jgi:hypothetical protein